MMKILHLAAGNRWTGAAAPAFAEVEALRQAGVDAHFAYVGGYKLEAKLRDLDFAHPIIEKAQNPAAFRRTARAVAGLARRIGADFIHAHLTYDHWLARVAARSCGARLARTFHARRVLRSDPFTASLIRATSALFVINDAFLTAAPIRDRTPHFTPPPVRLSEFSPDGPNARAAYGIAPDTQVVAMIGKLSKSRGFESGLESFSMLRRHVPGVRLMIIGHGEHRPALEALAKRLDIEGAVTWAGYHEDDLAEHYRAANALLFTEKGSDEGHRAILEAMACGVPPVAAPLEGVAALTGDLRATLVAADASPNSIALTLAAVLDRRENTALGRAVAAQVAEFDYAHAAARLIAGYGSKGTPS